MTISDRQRYLMSETAIGSGMNIIMSWVAALVSGGGRFAPPTVSSMIPQTFMVAFMSVLVATLLTHRRQRHGRLASAYHASVRFNRMVPGNAVLRALSAGIICLIIAMPIIGATLQSVLTAVPGPAGVALATAAHALLLSLLFTPVALILALNDQWPAAAATVDR